MKTIYKLFIALGMLSLVACERHLDEEEDQAQTPTATPQDNASGKVYPSPLEIGNVRAAWESLRARGEISARSEAPEANLLYVKFKPRSWEEWTVLTKDASVAWHDYPMDREPPADPSTYHDPEVPRGMPIPQYAIVPADYDFPNVYYAVLQRIYNPESAARASATQDRGAQARQEQAAHSADYNKVVQEAFRRTERQSQGEPASAPPDSTRREPPSLGFGDREQPRPEEEGNPPDQDPRSPMDIPYEGGGGSSNNRPPLPPGTRGTIRVYDDIRRGEVAIYGARVRATGAGRNWQTEPVETESDQNGYYFLNINNRVEWSYSVVWERDDFSIHEEDNPARASYAGPSNRRLLGYWNYRFNTEDRLQWSYAHVFRAAHHYHYEGIQGLERPPGEVMRADGTLARLRIQVLPFYDGAGSFSCMSNGKVNGLVQIGRGHGLGAVHTAADLYGLLIHEFAHAVHWEIDRNHFKRILANYGSQWEVGSLIESWAVGVQVGLTRMAHEGYERSDAYIKSRRENDNTRPPYDPGTRYTGVAIDLMDGVTGRPNYYTYSRTRTSPYGRDYDQVEGYDLKDIENALRGANNWIAWRDNLKRITNRPTERCVDRLFDFWGGLGGALPPCVDPEPEPEPEPERLIPLGPSGEPEIPEEMPRDTRYADSP